MRVGSRALAVVLACLLVVGALPAGLGLVGAGAAAPPGMSTIPDAQVSADVPANESIALEPAALRDGRVLASDHAGTLEVVLTTAGHADAVMDSDAAAVSGDGLALVLRDDTHSAGREVALDAGVVRDALGYKPAALYGTHENGTEWTASANYRDGFLVFDVPHFSDNTVTFSGEVEIDATGATDGTQFAYQLGSVDATSDPRVEVTGIINTESETVSAASVSDGGTFDASVAGSLAPSGPAGGEPEVTFTGTGTTTEEGHSYSNLASGDTISVPVDGNVPPVGPSGSGEPQVTVRGYPGLELLYVDGSELKYRPLNGNDDNFAALSSLDAVGDFDGDDAPEAVIGDAGTVKYADEGGPITSVSGPDIYYLGPSVADFDGDGRGEVIGRGDGLHHQDSTGDAGTVTMDEPFDIGAGTGGMGDVDGDGHIEAAMARSGGGITFVDRFGSETTVSTPQQVDPGPMADFDGDGRPEVSFSYKAGGSQDFYVGYVGSDGSLVDHLDGFADGIGSPTGAGDIDSDGTPEIVYYRSSDQIVLMEPDGTRTETGLNFETSLLADIDGDATNDPAVDTDGDGTDEVAISGTFAGERTVSVPSLTTDDDSWSVSTSTGELGLSVNYTERTGSLDPRADIDGDGVDEVALDETLGPGESVSTALPSLSTADDTWTIGTTAEPVDVSLSLTERTVPADPAVELNGQTTPVHSGTLADGDTATVSLANETLQSETNRLNLSFGSSISVDAPAMAVDLAYNHSASDRVNTTYNTTAFEERYNVSRTYADATTDAQLTVPFASERIVGVSTLQYRINETGGWTSVDPANYRLEGTTLDVYLDGAYGGDLPAGATVEVRATGRRIDVEHGAVTVTDATKPGDELDTEIRVDSRSEGFAVNVGPTDDGKRVHYAYSDEYPTQDYVVITAAGDQDLHMPEAVVDDRVRISHIDAMVNATRGDVRIDVTDPGTDPELEVSPGPGGDGDPVTVKYYRTETGVKYLLNSLTRNIVLDSDVAESPAIFEDDDSSETWSILRDDGGNASSGGGGGGGPVAAAGQFAAQTGQSVSGALAGQALLVVGGLVGVVGVVLVGRRIFGGDGSEPAAPEPTSTTPDNGGGGGGIGGRLTGAVGGLVGVGRRAGGGLLRRGPRLVGGVARRGGSLLVAIGQGLLTRTGQLVRALAANRAASIALAVIASVAAVGTGFVSVPREVIILVVVAGVPVATYAALKRAGIYSRTVWLGSTVIAAVIGIEFAAPGTVSTAIEQLTSETVAPLLILALAGMGFLYWRARQSDASTPDEVNRIVLGNGGDE